MTFHRTLLVLSRGPLAGHNRRAVIVTKAVSSLANTTPFAVSSSVQGQWGMSMSRFMTTMVTWPGDEATMSPARAKLQHVLEEYRQNNFSQTLFSRFLKEMIHATDANHDGYISRSELSKLLDNIGAKGKLLDSEVQEIMDELGQMDEEQQELLIHIENLQDTLLHGVH